MNGEIQNYEVIYCADDDEYRFYCEIYDKLCIGRYYKNHLKSGTHVSNILETTIEKMSSINLFNNK